MKTRKPLSQKTRFEVFKRDSFTCQYCGAKAPDVLLEADHIQPVKEGGDNSIMNLVTSCEGCNAGKGARKLSDSSVVEKQRGQLAALEERRQQIEMMLQWRQGLNGVKDEAVGKMVSYIQDSFGCEINDSGRRKVARWVKKFNYADLLESVDTCAEQYLVHDKEQKVTTESLEHAFRYIPSVCAGVVRKRENPELNELYYIRGIMRKRFAHCNEPLALSYLKKLHELGYSPSTLKEWVLQLNNWSQFKSGCELLFTGEEGNGQST